MLRIERLEAAAHELCAAALLGDGWDEALTRFSNAADAHGAILMRNSRDRLLAAIATDEIADAVADFAAGRAPESSRQTRVPSLPGLGFRIDHDDYSPAELAVDPFYQEFLRPIGFFWHANVSLFAAGGETVDLGLKRHFDAVPYRREDVLILDAVLPRLQVAARLAHMALEAETRGMMKLLGRRGGVMFTLDASGLVRPHDYGDQSDEGGPLRVIRRRLVARDRTAQRGIDRAIASALHSSEGLGLAPLVSSGGSRQMLQVLRIPGVARDVFRAAAAIAVVITLDPHIASREPAHSALRSAFGLTRRQADVAGLLTKGLSLPDIASSLDMRVGTARFHLKQVFDKTGTKRQAEFVSLVSCLNL